MKIKRILTRKDGICLNARFEDGELVQLDAADFEDASMTGRIYVGRVQNIVQNIGAVFVEYQKGKTAYLEQKQAPDVRIGDSLLIQITREAAGSKPPRCTIHLSLNGHYVVLVQHSGKIAVSSKVRDNGLRRQLKERYASFVTEEYGFILRTNSAAAPEEDIVKEIRELEARFRSIKKGIYRVPFSCLYTDPAPFLLDIRDHDLTSETEIITDQVDIYAQLEEFLTERPENVQLHYYDDTMLSLYRLYSMERCLSEALQERVWLRSGAYLVIQPTEAMTVIDVNSGKAIAGKKDLTQTLLQINLEAAKETARQLRLRNLSGIIIVDFIDLPQKEAEELLLSSLRKLLRKDPVHTELIELSKLKFAVLTREKVRMPLSDQLKNAKKR